MFQRQNIGMDYFPFQGETFVMAFLISTHQAPSEMEPYQKETNLLPRDQILSLESRSLLTREVRTKKC